MHLERLFYTHLHQVSDVVVRVDSIFDGWRGDLKSLSKKQRALLLHMRLLEFIQ